MGKIAVYYHEKKQLNLKAMIKRLGGNASGRFHARSESEVARMLLEEALQAELEQSPSPPDRRHPTRNRSAV